MSETVLTDKRSPRGRWRNEPCVYCGRTANDVRRDAESGYKPLQRGRWRQPMTRDHIVPKGRGGRNHWGNYVVACDLCNRMRGTKPVLLFLVEQRALELRGQRRPCFGRAITARKEQP